MEQTYEPLEVACDLCQVTVEEAMARMTEPPKDGLTLCVSMREFDSRSWLDVVHGEWTRGVPVKVRGMAELAPYEWYLQNNYSHQRVGSKGP